MSERARSADQNRAMETARSALEKSAHLSSPTQIASANQYAVAAALLRERAAGMRHWVTELAGSRADWDFGVTADLLAEAQRLEREAEALENPT